MTRCRRILVGATVIVCCSLTSAHADIYQYTDKDGVVHFTNVDGGGRHQKKVRSEAPVSKAPAPVRHAPAARSAAYSSTNTPSAYMDAINRACERHGVDPSLVHAIVKVESDFNPFAMSRKGAMGLMQLMPETAQNMNVKNSFDPAQNIDGGVKYLRYLIDRYEGNLSLALAAYNSGETAVKRWGTIPPFKETQNYVQRIMRIYNGESAKGYVSRYTIYMGYGEDGALVLTDNPSTQIAKKAKTRKKSL